MSENRSMELPVHDELWRLASDDPQAFEALRLALIENCINGAPERIQLDLRRLQFRVDGIRRRSRSPLGATLKIQALMWESFLDLNDKLQHLVRLSPERPHLPGVRKYMKQRPTGNAQVVAQVVKFSPRPALATR